MKISTHIYQLLLFLAASFSSCSTDVKIGRGNYFGKRCKIINGQLGGLNYVMLVTHGKNKYPLSVIFRQDMKPFFATKTTVFENKFVTWHCVTDTANNLFRSFGVKLVGGVALRDRTFIPISEEDKKVLYDFSDLLIMNRPALIISKDSVNRLIGWVKATD
jgi:hypothetical protein